MRGEFLRALRRRDRTGRRLVIFDELSDGFAFTLGGAQALYDGMKPDLTTLARSWWRPTAGGGCVAGRGARRILAHLEFGPGQDQMKHPGHLNANRVARRGVVSAFANCLHGRTAGGR